MKIKHIVLSASILVSVSAMAQKDELKSLKRIYGKDEIKANDLADYKVLVSKLEPLAVEEGDKVYAGFYKAMTPVIAYKALDKSLSPERVQTELEGIVSAKVVADFAQGLNTTLDYEKKVGKKIYTDNIIQTITTFKPQLINYAVTLGSNKQYGDASSVLFSVYQLDKTDQDKLFYAAGYAVNALDYEKALDYYTQLKNLKYTGSGFVYWATNKASKAEETFPTKVERELYLKAGTHEKPRDEKIESKAGEIYKNIALILVQQGKIDEAKEAFAVAKKENPNDNSLVYSELDLYLKIKDMNGYTTLVNEALEKNPNNIDLIYNLGVISADANKIEEAQKYYRRALDIDPNYFNANLNLAELLLRGDAKFVTEMNKLGTTEKDNKRFDVLKAERNKNFNSVLPYLEKACQIKPEDETAKKTLLSVYNALEMTEKYKALKAKM